MPIKAKFEFDQEDGKHRIVVDGKKSDWTHYDFLSTLKVGDQLYIGATQNWEGVLPTERVLAVTEIESTAEYINVENQVQETKSKKG